MGQTLDQGVLQDEVARSLARAVAVANERARREGVDLHTSLINVAEHFAAGETFWRIDYAPRDYLQRRGGDLVIDVGADDGAVRRVLRGQ